MVFKVLIKQNRNERMVKRDCQTFSKSCGSLAILAIYNLKSMSELSQDIGLY